MKLPKLSFPFKSFLVYLGTTALDFVSSFGKYPAGFHEGNPFARHVDGSFYPMHALENCALDSAEILLVCAGLYFVVSYFHKKSAVFASALPWLYYAYGHFDAAIQNIQVKLFFVPYSDPSKIFEMLKSLIGF